MLTKREAIETVRERLDSRSGPCTIIEEETIERAFGWILFYNSTEYVETGIDRYLLAGNGPVFVNKRTGETVFHGPLGQLAVLIKEYEIKWASAGSAGSAGI